MAMVKPETVRTAPPSPSYCPTPLSSPIQEHQPATVDQVKRLIRDAIHALTSGSQSHLAELLSAATEKLATAKDVNTSPAADVENEPTKECNPQIKRASTLDYKRVDEAYALIPWKVNYS
jgi:hypothetical protein